MEFVVLSPVLLLPNSDLYLSEYCHLFLIAIKEYLLFTDIILDVSIIVPNHLDTIISGLVSNVVLDWNVF